MKSTLISIALLLGLGAYGQAHATCGTGTAMSATTGRCEITQAPTTPQTQTTTAVTGSSTSEAGAGATSDASADGSSANSYTNRSALISLPAPVSAAPLPAGFCDTRKSSSGALGWNFVSKATSEAHLDTDRIDQCERLLKASRSLTPQQMAFEHCSPQTDVPGCVVRMMHAFTAGQALAAPVLAQTIDLKAATSIAAPVKAKRKKRVVTLDAGSKTAELCEDGWRAVMKHCPRP